MTTSKQNFKFPAKVRTTFYVITATGLTLRAADYLNFPPFCSLNSSSFFPEKIRAAIHAVFRSSRAISTVRFLSHFRLSLLTYFQFLSKFFLFPPFSWQIGFTIADYKYSLRGLPVDSEGYRGKLSEVCRFLLFGVYAF